MPLGFKLCVLPAFQPGETILHFKKCVWALSCKSSPTYRLFFSLPPLMEAAMYVTDRRILLLDCVVRLFPQEFSIWFAHESPGQDQEMFETVSASRGRWSGSYLELVSRNVEPHWYRSRELRLRLFMRDPETLRQLISETARKGSLSAA
jgi:hypothetical protein